MEIQINIVPTSIGLLRERPLGHHMELVLLATIGMKISAWMAKKLGLLKTPIMMEPKNLVTIPKCGAEDQIMTLEVADNNHQDQVVVTLMINHKEEDQLV